MTPPARSAFPQAFGRTARVIAAGLLVAGWCCDALATDWTILTDDAPGNMAFAQALRSGLEADRIPPSTVSVTSLRDPASPPTPSRGSDAPTLAQGDEESANVGVRTRSLRPALPPAPTGITVAVGPAAAREALGQPDASPLLLAMLGRLEYEELKGLPAMRRGERRIAALLREPSIGEQLALIHAVLPDKRRLGVVVTEGSEPVLQELQRASANWSLQVERAPDPSALGIALRALVARSDALLILPDRIGESQAATLAVLRAGAAAGLPVFGSNDGMVRSGGLAAAVSTPAQLARQAEAMALRLAEAPVTLPRMAFASPPEARVNPTVARGLDLRLPSEQELTARIRAAR